MTVTDFDPSIRLDHMVINARLEMDEAQATFESLGFTVTPRGYHTLGSINHLMVFESDYLELLGLPADAPSARPEIADAPKSIDGLVFKTDDVHTTYRHLCNLGIEGDPPKSFSRPVDIDGASREASFRTVTVRPDVFPAGRVYFCQHLTPQFLWRDEWQKHANTARHTREFVVVASGAATQAERFGALLAREPGAPYPGAATVDLGGSTLVVMEPDAYRQRYGELALECPDGASRFGAIVLGCESHEPLDHLLAAPPPGCRARRAGDAVQVAVDGFATVLEFQTMPTSA